MMHNMHDLQCLNACITPGCYSETGESERERVGTEDGEEEAKAARRGGG